MAEATEEDLEDKEEAEDTVEEEAVAEDRREGSIAKDFRCNNFFHFGGQG